MIARAFLAALAALFLSFPAVSAVTLAERSPFTQGQWWNPSRSGNGFEIFSTSDQVAVIWYTFEESGRPVWYTAQGAVTDLGAQTWPLMKHRWANGRISSSTSVGTLRLNVKNADQLEAVWKIGATEGTWNLEPLKLSGVINEIDHSGSWFAATNSGWGISLTDQGPILGGAIFTYDAAGEPTWLAGFERSRSSVEFYSCTGACPSCPYSLTQTRSAGRLAFEFQGETSMTIRSELSVPMAAGVALQGARLVPLSIPASARTADRRLARFPSEPTLKSYLEAGMLNVSGVINPGVDFSPPPPSTAFSQTNLQEIGVDEADLVKTDGTRVYAFAKEGTTHPLKARLRVAEVAGQGAELTIKGVVPIASAPEVSVESTGLYLHGSALVTVTGTVPYAYFLPVWTQTPSWRDGKTYVEIFDTSGSLPTSRWRMEVDGHLVSSRRIGDRLYVIARHVPNLPGFVMGARDPAQIAANERLLAEASLESLLPKARINGGATATLVSATQVYAPPLGVQGQIADLILVYAIDLATPGITQALAIAGRVDTVYASPTNLYLSSSRYTLRNPSGYLLPVEPSYYVTDLHQIRLGTKDMSIVASGSVEGHLGFLPDRGSFRMSESQGRLRVVTSNNSGMWGGMIKNRLTILEPSTVASGLLKTVSYLPNEQRPESLGKPGEQVYGTRYVGDKLYAVTFRQVDPLYVVDLSNPADPVITGALEVPGFSDYLHPLPGGLLIGLGKSATSQGLFQGLQLSLYDIRDQGKPRELQRVLIGQRGSESAALTHHHAFSALTQNDGSIQIAFPARIHDAPGPSPDGLLAPWLQSGLMRYELRGNSFISLPMLVSHKASQQGSAYFSDPATYGGRGILFPNGALYIGDGTFWRGDAAGNVTVH